MAVLPSSPSKKRAQKESVLLRAVASLFLQIIRDQPLFKDLFVSRVALSSDNGLCYVFFYSHRGQTYFDEVTPTLKLYKPSLRKALATSINSRYTPEIAFRFDDSYDKQMNIERIIQSIATTDEHGE